jgi:hypothetical protein
VGASKLVQFGPQFLAAIQTHAQQYELSEKPVPRRGSLTKVTRTAGQTMRDGSTYAETKRLIEQKLSLEAIAAERGMTVGTIISHIEKLLAAQTEQFVTSQTGAGGEL